jgi:timeless protein
VITLQKLLQDFLESNLSESSEDNESNTSNQYQPGSCSPSSDDSSDQQPSRDNSPTHMVHSPESSHSCGSLNVLPNNSPAPSTDPGSLDNPASPMSVQSNPMISAPNNGANPREATAPVVEEEEEVQEEFVQPSPVSTNPPKGENTSSGIDSEIFSRGNSSEGNSGGEQPPHKVYMSENEKGEKVIVERRTTEPTEYVHKQRRTDKMLVPPNAPRRAPKSPTKNAKVGASSSDNSDITGIPKKPKSPKAPQSLVDSDFGYVSQQIMDQQDISSSSNEDEHQKPLRTNPVKPRAQVAPKLSPDDKKEKHRQKLLKKSRENRMRVKAMVNHIPTDKDISELLKEFTVDFLHNGYSKLVKELLEKLSRKDCDISMDKSHFLWLLTYFLKFASQLEIGLDQIGSIISFRILSYITYQGVELLETLEVANRERSASISGHLRRMHLVVTALREFIQTIVNYGETKSLTLSDKQHLRHLQKQSVHATDIRQLLVLLLRSFNPQIQSMQYLSDLVVCNHMLLLTLESVTHRDNPIEGVELDMTHHMSQFANPELMRQYGRLLEDFQNNTPFLNDCIFTVMHHIAGDLNSPQNLYLPSILKSFSKIWEQGLQICEDWVDLIEFIIQKFIQTMGSSPHTCAANMVKCLDYTEVVDESGLTGIQTNKLFWHFTQVENTVDPVGSLIEIYKQTDNIILSRLVVIQALLSHGVITHAQYMNFIYMKNVINNCKTEHEGSVIAEVGSEHCNSEGHMTDSDEAMETCEEKRKSEIQVLKDCLVSQGRAALIPWLQQVLLAACRVKMYPDELEPVGSDAPQEPTSFYYNKANQSIPLVPWNRFQYQGLQTEAFILLLHKLGFQLPADVGKVFPRIPHFWSADHIYSVAVKLGPIDTKKLQFSLEELERISAAASPSLNEEPAMPVRRPSTQKSLSDNEDFDNMEEMYLLEDATRPTPTATSYVDLAAASKAMRSPKTKAPSEASSQEYMDMN